MEKLELFVMMDLINIQLKLLVMNYMDLLHKLFLIMEDLLVTINNSGLMMLSVHPDKID